MSQRERILRALQRAGKHGICAYDFNAVGGVLDGGPQITRVAARIEELKASGHRIRTAGRRQGHVVYVIDAGGDAPSLAPPPDDPDDNQIAPGGTNEPERQRGAHPPGAPTEPPLFEPPTGSYKDPA